MLKTRIIPILTFNGFALVKTKKFEKKWKKFKTRDEAQQYMDTKEIVANIGTMHIANGSAIAIPNPLSPDQQYAFNKYKLNNNDSCKCIYIFINCVLA